MREINNKYDGAATEARAAVKVSNLQLLRQHGHQRRRLRRLTRTLIRIHWTTDFMGALGMFLIGCLSRSYLFDKREAC